MSILRHIRPFSQSEIEQILGAQARLDAKREERKRLYPSAAGIPVITMKEAVPAALRHIESRVIWIETDEGLLPIANALEGGAVWLTDDSGERVPLERVEIWGSL